LYYCTNNAVNYRKSLSITSCLYFTVPAIYELTQTANIEEFDRTDKLKDEIQKENISSKNKKAANAKHDKPGGSRQKANDIKEIWATGNYTSRDDCAKEVHDALGMSFSAARKALRNTPDPT
jgi:hypothetical protein